MLISRFNFFSFIYGLGSAITVRVLGILSISEIISLILFPLMFSNFSFKNDKRFYKLIILLIFWLFGVVLSDIYNNTSTINFIKGFFSIIPFLTCLIFSYWLLSRDIKLIIPFLWGYSCSYALGSGLGLDAYYIDYVAREGLDGVTQLVHYDKILVWIVNVFITGALSISFYYKYPKTVISLIFLVSIVSLILGSRSTFLTNLFIVVFLIFLRVFTNKIPTNGFIWQDYLGKKLLLFLSIILASGFLAKSIYETSASRGLLGVDEYNKFLMQSTAKIGLLSGRGEFVASYLAIIDSPIFGHGSYAVDSKGYGYKAGLIAGYSDFNIDQLYNKIGESLIPTHSHIFTAWVNYGLLGGLFWCYVLIFILFKFFKSYLFLFPQYIGFIFSALIGAFWVILFSPFSQKPYLAMILVFFIILMKIKDSYVTKF